MNNLIKSVSVNEDNYLLDYSNLANKPESLLELVFAQGSFTSGYETVYFNYDDYSTMFFILKEGDNLLIVYDGVEYVFTANSVILDNYSGVICYQFGGGDYPFTITIITETEGYSGEEYVTIAKVEIETSYSGDDDVHSIQVFRKVPMPAHPYTLFNVTMDSGTYDIQSFMRNTAIIPAVSAGCIAAIYYEGKWYATKITPEHSEYSGSSEDSGSYTSYYFGYDLASAGILPFVIGHNTSGFFYLYNYPQGTDSDYYTVEEELHLALSLMPVMAGNIYFKDASQTDYCKSLVALLQDIIDKLNGNEDVTLPTNLQLLEQYRPSGIH